MNDHRVWDDSLLAALLLDQPGVGRKKANQWLRLLLRPDRKADWRTLLKRSVSTLLRSPWFLPEPLAYLLNAAIPPALSQTEDVFRRLAEKHISAITPLHPEYPVTLIDRLGDDTPPLLFRKGANTLLQHSGCAVVGARQASREGCAMARKCTEILAREHQRIISGAAAGIDSVAHQTALEEGAATVLVLPEGIGGYELPRRWAKGYEEERLLLLSETRPYAPWSTPAAVARNRIIAALSHIVCVFEPRKTGGSMATASHAVSYGIPVFCFKPNALPGGLQRAIQPLSAADDEGWILLRKTARHPESPLTHRQESLF